MKKAIGIGLLFAALTCGGLGAAHADVINGRDADPLSPRALAQLYAGKTWYWKTVTKGSAIVGTAYFAPDGSCRIVMRESNPARLNETPHCAWSPHEYGILTMEAYWQSTPSRGFLSIDEWRHSRMSFSHEQDAGGNIFQRKGECPSGDWPWNGYSWDHAASCAAYTPSQWYVFKHRVPAKHDEWWKVQPGNHTAEVLRWKM